MSIIKLLTLFIFLLIVGPTVAQDYIVNTQTFSLEDGLSHRTVRHFAQDARGFMWMSTGDGLNRFDGYNFKVYTKEKHGLRSNNISRVFLTADSLLLLTYKRDIDVKNALDIFDPLTGEAVPLENYMSQKLPFDLTSVDLGDIEKNKDGTLWLPTTNAVYEFGKQKSLKKILTIPDTLKVLFLTKIDGNKGGWFSTHTDRRTVVYFHFNNKGEIVDQTPKHTVAGVMHSSRIVHVRKDGTLLYSVTTKDANGQEVTTTYEKKLYEAPTVFDYSTRKNYRHQRYAPYHDQLWCSNSDGTLDVFDTQGEFLHHANTTVKLALHVGSSFFDRQGGYWLNFDSKTSLTYIEPNPFTCYLSTPKNVLAGRGIAESANGTIYMSGNLGSFELPKGASEPTSLPHPAQFYGNRNLDTALRVAILVEKDETVWLTDEFNRLLHYYPKEKRYEFYSYEKVTHSRELKKFITHINWSLYKDAKERIWIGHERGLSYLDKTKGIIQQQTDYNGFAKLTESEVFHFHENKHGVWLATSSGLYRLNHDMEVEEWFHPQGDQEHYLPHGVIAHLHEDKDGSFWLASKGGGLIHWDYKTKDYQQYAREEGLANNVIYAIYEDHYDNLWFSSNMGLMSMNKTSKLVRNYLPQNGIPNEEFNTISHCKTKDGRLFFGTTKGIIAFHPKDFQEKRQEMINKVQICSYTKFYYDKGGHVLDLTNRVFKTKELVVLPQDRTAILNFSVLDYRNPHSVIYAYKIVGLDEEWTYTDRPEMNLVGIPIGQYKFLIKTQDSNVDPFSITLAVRPPFYLRTWFIALMLMLLIIVISMFVRIRERNLKHQKTILEEQVKRRTIKIQQQTEDLRALDKLKSRFFANISHELRTPLTLILGPLSQLIGKKKYEEDKTKLLSIQRNGKQLLQLVEEILDLSKLDANKLEMNEKSVSLSAFVHRVYDYFESQAVFQGIRYDLECEIDESWHVLLDEDKVEKILNNFISNALKFTPEGEHMKLRVYSEDSQLFFVVQDTGKGIHPDDLPHVFERFYQTKQSTNAEGGTGIGLAFCKELAHLMNGQLTVESTFGEGATFTFSLALKLVQRASIVPVETPIDLLAQLETAEKELTTDLSEQRFTVMLVEDNRDMQQYVQSLLMEDYNIITCSNGQKAWDYLQDNERVLPDLILSDVMMPQMDGFTLLGHCKNNARTRGIPMIMLTARSATKDKLNALTIGVDDYLTKPFIVDELQARVKNLLSNAHARKVNNKALEKAEPVIVTEKVEDIKEEEVVAEATKPKEEEKEEKAPKVVISESDQLWIKEVEGMALESVDDADFDAEALAKSVGMSRRNLQRRLKKVTGLTPGQYLREIRLQTARDLLERGVYQTIAEVAYAAGFTTPYYFSQIYKKRFGKKASSYFSNLGS